MNFTKLICVVTMALLTALTERFRPVPRSGARMAASRLIKGHRRRISTL